MLEGKMDIYGQIIFVDNPEVFGNSLEASGRKVLFLSINVNSGGGGIYKEEINKALRVELGLQRTEVSDDFIVKSTDGFIFPNNRDLKYECIYVHINNVNKILEGDENYYYRAYYFYNHMYKFVNGRIFFTVDKLHRNYVIEQINSHIELLERLKRSSNEKYKQLLFVDDIKDVRIDECDFFSEIEGKQCKSFDDLCNELESKLQFPKRWGRNLDAINDFMGWFGWLEHDRPYKSLFFIHIKDVKCIMPSDDETWDRVAFFDILGDGCCYRAFIIIDKKDKDFVLGEIEKYKKLKESERAKT
jgi:RNAse (barnase) inhibitor barstar